MAQGGSEQMPDSPEDPVGTSSSEAPPSEDSVGSGARKTGSVGLILTLAIAAVVIAGVALLFHSSYYTSPAGVLVATPVGSATVDGQTLQHVTLAFNTYPDSTGMVNGQPIHPSGNPGWPAYGPTNQFQVPAHALVTVNVRQYDSGGALNNPYFAVVRGTIGGVAKVNGKLVHSIDPNNVGHTFTVRGAPGTDPAFFLSVPFPAVPGNNQADNGQYESVSFSFISGTKGTYAWNCEFPCGTQIAGFGGPMSAFGFMSGFIHVV
jgi:hypothetical protein